MLVKFLSLVYLYKVGLVFFFFFFCAQFLALVQALEAGISVLGYWV